MPENIFHIRASVLAYLREERVAVLATASRLGTPHAATVFFDVDGDFNIFFFSSAGTQKMHHLRRNKHVAMVGGARKGPTTVQIAGDAYILEEKETLPLLSRL